MQILVKAAPTTHRNHHLHTQLEEYKQHHDAIWPEVREALRSVGLTNISLWAWPPGGRLFYYAEYIGSEPLDAAMARYAAMPCIAEWEELMHTYQRQLPVPGKDGSSRDAGQDGSVWWHPMDCVYSSDF